MLRLFAFLCLVCVPLWGVRAESNQVFSSDYIVVRGNVKPDATIRSLIPKYHHSFHKIPHASVSRLPRSLGDTNNTETNGGCAEILLDPTVVGCSPDFLITVDGKLEAQQVVVSQAPSRKMDGRQSVGADIVVAVIDTGVDYSHPDLREHMWHNPGEIEGNGVDDDKNGYVDDVFGVNTADGTGDPMDQNGHGTHVAGIILNTVGELGPNSGRVKIMALRFLNAQGMGGLLAAIKSLEYLVDMKRRGVDVRISNNSWGGAPYSDVLMSAVTMVKDADIAFVAAAGNFGNDNSEKPEYPASLKLSNIISVAAVDADNNLASFSNYGANSVHIAAPGVKISSTFLNNSYRSMSGTSMAAPVFAGELALFSMGTKFFSTTEFIEAAFSTVSHSSTLKGLVIDERVVSHGSQNGQGQGAREPTVDSNIGGALSSIELKGIDGAGISRDVLRSGYDLEIKGKGLGSPRVTLDLSFDSYVCRNALTLQLSEGQGQKGLRLGSLAKWFHRIIVIDQSSGIRAKIVTSRGQSKRRNRVSNRRAASVCSRVSAMEY